MSSSSQVGTQPSSTIRPSLRASQRQVSLPDSAWIVYSNFIAYIFAPGVLVTPLGALSIIVSSVLAHFVLKERLEKLGVLGCVSCIVEPSYSTRVSSICGDSIVTCGSASALL
uniref:Probable magnesium transporter n=1 Tax=Zea mays TaxID=4577 RepID=A0A804N5H0_MAIZE